MTITVNTKAKVLPLVRHVQLHKSFRSMFRLLRTVIADSDAVIVYGFSVVVAAFVLWARLGRSGDAQSAGKLLMDAAGLCLAAGVILVRSAVQDSSIRRGFFRQRIFVLGAGEQ